MKVLIIALIASTMVVSIACSIMARQIDGLTTRVNLLEARIHWQEEPPK